MRRPGAKPWIRLLVREATESLNPGHVKACRHIGDDGMPDLVSCGDKWAGPGPRCRSVACRVGSRIGGAPDFAMGRAIYSDKLRSILRPGAALCVGQQQGGALANTSMPLPPRGVTLGSILCPSQGRLIRTLKEDKTEAFPIEPGNRRHPASHSGG